ncbi:MAG: 6-carboxytetrahydropterin synthase [Chloroflexi bacterium]|nr:6-carboxytetrahydropterin synthase [Chloroflexota bacterium]
MVALPLRAIEMPEHLWEVGAADPHGLSVGIDCLVSIDDFFNARRRCPTPDAPNATVALSCRFQVQAYTVGVGNDGDLVAAVAQIVAAYDGAVLDDLPPFRDAEVTLARLSAVIFQQLDYLLSSTLKVLDAVTVWETPTLSATIRRSSGR